MAKEPVSSVAMYIHVFMFPIEGLTDSSLAPTGIVEYYTSYTLNPQLELEFVQ